MKRVGGIITFKKDGQQFPAKGEFTYGFGTPKREPVMGADGHHGFKETPQVAFIEGAITDSYGTDVVGLFNSTGVTALLELANGKTVVLREAYYAGEGTGKTSEGEIAVRFEGEKAEEIK